VVIGIDCGRRRRQPWSSQSSASTVVFVTIGRGRRGGRSWSTSWSAVVVIVVIIIIDAVVPASQVIDIAGVAAQVRMGRRPNNKTIYHRRSSFLVRGHAPAGIIVAIKGGRHHHRCGQGL